MTRPLGLNRQTVKHPRLADGEIADVESFPELRLRLPLTILPVSRVTS